MKRWSTLVPVLALGLASLAHASGEVWRYTAPPRPIAAAAEVTVAPEDAAPHEGRMRRRERRRALPTPDLVVEVQDGAGRPVPGVGVEFVLSFGRRAEHALRRAGATDERGTCRLRPTAAIPITDVLVIAELDGGAKAMRVNLDPTREGDWRHRVTHYRNAGSGRYEGSCGNLVALRGAPAGPTGVASYRLRVVSPDSLLQCEAVAYGVERKAAELARLDDVGRRDVNRGDRNFFSPADEEAMGVEAAAHFDEQFEQVTDPAIVGYVQGVLDRVLAASDAPDMETHLRVVNTDSVNAFVTAGGNVYVFTGLLKAAENESQLAGVLAHETSHAIARHVTEGATRQLKTQLGTFLGAAALGELLGLEGGDRDALTQGGLVAAGLVGMRYDRRAESEADLLGAQYLWRAGWDPEGIARFFEVLDRQGGGASVPGWLSTHPTHERRIEDGIHWSRAFLPQRDRYLLDTAEFQAARRRVEALPPPRREPDAEAAGAGLASLYAETGPYRSVLETELRRLVEAGDGR